MSELDTSKIVQVPLPESQYFKQEFPKNQIVIHHTAGGPNALNVVAGWKASSDRVATAFIIDGSGVIHQCFSSKHWAHHLGTTLANNVALNKNSVAIEVTNWGGLEKGGYTKAGKFVAKDATKFYSYAGTAIPASQVLDLGSKWHGSRYYHLYSDAQIESLRQLLVYLGKTYAIPLDYIEGMWDLNNDAMAGKKGLYTHVSYRIDKQDMWPQPKLIDMLKQLASTV